MTLVLPVLNSVTDYLTVVTRATMVWERAFALAMLVIGLLVLRVNQLSQRH